MYSERILPYYVNDEPTVTSWPKARGAFDRVGTLLRLGTCADELAFRDGIVLLAGEGLGSGLGERGEAICCVAVAVLRCL
jgi:hypothetical protein